MSPEQLQQGDIDGRSDLYSLGVVLYETLCGHSPFEAETVREMQEQILQANPPEPSHRVKYPIPKLLEEVTMNCLAKSPQDRPDDALDVVRLLQEAI
jgi:serine/threonine protein kinase